MGLTDQKNRSSSTVKYLNDALVIFAFVMHDFGWVTMIPEIGIPALTIAFCLQVHVVQRMDLRRHHVIICACL